MARTYFPTPMYRYGVMQKPGGGGSPSGAASDPNLILDSSSQLLRGTITRSTFGTIYNSAKEIEYVGANLPRWDYLNGVSKGLYISDINTNQFYPSNPRLTDIPLQANLTEVSVSLMGGALDWALIFGDNSVLRQARASYADVTAVDNTFGFYVVMDDGGVPVIGNSAITGDFWIYMDGNGVTTAANLEVELVSSAENVYRIRATKLHDGAGTGYGVHKETTQSARGFKVVGGWNIDADSDQVQHLVPTTISAVFQNADEHSYTLGAEWDATSGVIQVRGELSDTVDGENGVLCTVSDGTTANRIIVFRNAANQLQLTVVAGAATQAVLTTTETYLNGDIINVCARYGANDFAIVANDAAAPVTDVAGVVPVVTTCNIGSNSASAAQPNAHILLVKLHPTMNDADLRTLSAL